MFPSSTKREITHFHVVIVQRRLRNVQKCVMHVQSCCFANINLLVFCRSRCRRRRLCLSSLCFGVLGRLDKWIIVIFVGIPSGSLRVGGGQAFFRKVTQLFVVMV